MQIHEITESILSNIGRGLASGVTGIDIPQSQASIDRRAAQAAQQLRKQGYGKTQTPAGAGSIERITVSVTQPGQTVPAKYIKTGTVWTNELGAVITDPKQKTYLDSLIPAYGKKEILPAAQPTPATGRKISRRRASK